MNTIPKTLIILALALLPALPLRAADPVATRPAASQPATPASDELLKHVQDRLRSVESVESDFIQEKHLAVFDHTLIIRGHFALKKPNRLIWIVRQPVRYAVLVEGEKITQWDQDTNHVQVIHLAADPTFKAVSDQLQAWFLGDYKVLAQTFDVYLQGQNPLSLGFVPKPGSAAAKIIEHVDLTFGKDDLYIQAMDVREVGGDLTTLKFTGTRINEPVKDETWDIPPHEH